MSVKVTLGQLEQQLPELLDQAVKTGETYIVQRNGKDYAVLVSAREWKKRSVGKRLDGLGSGYRLPPDKQARAEALLVKKKRAALSRAERRELDSLLRECDAIMLRRTKAIDAMV
jgi:prevent-host-death family protein